MEIYSWTMTPVCPSQSNQLRKVRKHIILLWCIVLFIASCSLLLSETKNLEVLKIADLMKVCPSASFSSSYRHRNNNSSSKDRYYIHYAYTLPVDGASLTDRWWSRRAPTCKENHSKSADFKRQGCIPYDIQQKHYPSNKVYKGTYIHMCTSTHTCI